MAVTDRSWYEFLRSLEVLDEVNFWQPSGNTEFAAVDIGEPIIFKLHYPENQIVGAGFFTWFSILPSRMAWDAFQLKNGAPTYDEMRTRVERYRRAASDPRAEYQIGCVLLRDVFFLPRDLWVRAPDDWQPNIVRGKTYDLSTGEGARVWNDLMVRAPGQPQLSDVDVPPMFGPEVLARRRLGQGTFRTLVVDAYDRRCAITAEKTLPVLDAAHIRPVASGGIHRIGNGLLLRSDLHTLFDQGYLTVSPDFRVRVSQRLRTDFDNGEHYRAFDGTELRLPNRPEFRPDPHQLEWHGDTVFKS
ncbi:MAG TPA: HNH endonuclease [Candidatus Limnocylindria bacterium]|nr:HNH endonuclease [Candidatus Limnocylindria bacterium]